MFDRNGWLALVDPFNSMDNFSNDFFKKGMIGFGTDVTDEGDSYQLKADLPGFNKEDISIDVNNDVLTVSAERHSEAEDKSKHGKFIRQERTYGSYQRTFDLSDVKADEISASYENGVLTLNLPKKVEEAPKSRKIEIQ